MEELTALVALSRTRRIGNVRKKWLVENHGSIAALFEGREKARDEADREAIGSFRDFESIDSDLSVLSRMDASVITVKDSAYPLSLRAIPDPPIVLYKLGPFSLPTEAFAVVGARKATHEGILVAERIAETLSSAGITVVSGLAKGIDAAAHRGALPKKGRTVGVLGCGIDRCYPAENWSLFRGIAQEGALLTEYAPGEKPWPGNFPQRNRIIAGLSKGVLVVEASRKSGSLITARLALDYGREVMALPGRVFDEAYKGTNNLIKQGARLVEDIGDIVACCFPGVEFRTKSSVDMDSDEDYIYRLMGIDRVHVEVLIEKSGFETKRVMAILTRLEMKDVVRPIAGGFYLRKV
ncbi:MAG: DNA-processing protein DprA [Syntrophorhabdales bacterium]|jgi:DNA processing protein